MLKIHFNLAAYWKRKYNQKTEKEPWFLLTNLEDFEEVIKTYRHPMGIKATYNQRAGIESTYSQGIQRSGLRQSPYIGLQKTHTMQVFIACALNLVRLDAWLAGKSKILKELLNIPLPSLIWEQRDFVNFNPNTAIANKKMQ